LGVKVLGVLTTVGSDGNGGSGKPVVAYTAPELDRKTREGSTISRREVQEQFDHVVIATQAHQALGLLAAPHEAKSEKFGVVSSGSNTAVGDVMPIPWFGEYQQSLGGFTYEQSRVVVHQDPRLMPSSRRQWSPLNILVPGVSDPSSTMNSSTMPMCSVWMTKIDARVSPDVYQTWNPLLEPHGEIFADGEFERPVVSIDSARCMKRLQSIQGKGGIHFVGAYALHAVPLLENGVRSAMQTAERIDPNCRAPWLGGSVTVNNKRELTSWKFLVGFAVAGGGLICLLSQAPSRKPR
jgi:predicted NAD/FAD-binding protein